MAPEIVRADSGMDALIWLILGAIWLIAQAVSRLRGGGQERRPPLPTGEKSLEEDLKTLFEQLSGKSIEPPQPPMSTPPPTPPPIVRPMKPIPYGAGKRLPKPLPTKHKTVERITQQYIQVKPPPEMPVVAVIPEIHEIPPLSVSRSRGGMFKESMFSFNAIKTSLPATQPLGIYPMGVGAHLRRLVKGRKPLKQAMISRIVLGPPKAFSI